MEALFIFNFREVSLSSRSRIKITFKGRVDGMKSESLREKKATYSTLKTCAYVKKTAC